LRNPDEDGVEPVIEQATPHEPFRLISAGQDFVMQAKLGETCLCPVGVRCELPDMSPGILDEIENGVLSRAGFVHELKVCVQSARPPDRLARYYKDDSPYCKA
jgi:hypothetical protein